MTVECGFPRTWSRGWPWTRRLTLNHMVDLENHMVEVDDVMARLCFKRKVRFPPSGTLTLRLKHHLATTSSTSTIWFSRSTIWLKVNRLVQGQPRNQVQGNPHSTVVSLWRQYYGWPPSWTDQRRPLLLTQLFTKKSRGGKSVPLTGQGTESGVPTPLSENVTNAMDHHKMLISEVWRHWRPSMILFWVESKGTTTNVIVIMSITWTVYLSLLRTMTNKCTIISQIITLLYISTLSCHPQGACNQYLAKLHWYFKCSCS
jgi:hypothetical protein